MLSWVVKVAPHLVLPPSLLLLYIPSLAPKSSNSRRFTLLPNFLPQLLSFHTLLFSIFFRPFLFNRLGTATWGVGDPASGSPVGALAVGNPAVRDSVFSDAAFIGPAFGGSAFGGSAPNGLAPGDPARCNEDRTSKTCHPERSEGSAFFRRLFVSPSQAAPSPVSSFRHYFIASLLHLSRGFYV